MALVVLAQGWALGCRQRPAHIQRPATDSPPEAATGQGWTPPHPEVHSIQEPLSDAGRRRLVEELFLSLRTGVPALESLLAPEAVLKTGASGSRQLRHPSRDQLLGELDAVAPSRLDYDPLSIRVIDSAAGRSFIVDVIGTQTRPGRSTETALLLTVSAGAGPVRLQVLEVATTAAGDP